MKNTPFTAFHEALGAKMVEFAGYRMPIQYSGIVAEHLNVRENAGLFDVSHMGEFLVRGPQAYDFVEYATTNKVHALVPGQVQYSVMCYPDGGIVDDLLVYRFEDGFMLVVNASNIGKDFEHLKGLSKNFDVEFKNTSDSTGLLALQGPASRDILKKLTQLPLDELDFYHFLEGEVNSNPMILSRTGYTGELGYELYHDPAYSGELWDALMQAGEEFKLTPTGLGARDTLRLEMKFCLYGNDIDETTHPLEARLAWVVDLDGPEFVAQDVLRAKKAEGIQRFLVAFEMEERGLPRHGYIIMADGQQVGIVTSGGQSPSLGKGIGLGYVNKGHHKIGTPLQIDIRGKGVAGRIIKPPFINKKTS